jgi:hypothetical protein
VDRHPLQDTQVVEHYLSGELTMRQARAFEQYCLEHPEVLKELPIPVRLKARLAREPVAHSETGLFPAIPSGTTRAAIDAAENDFDQPDEHQASQRGAGRANRWLASCAAIALIAAIGTVIAYRTKANALTQQIETLVRDQRNSRMHAPGSVQTYRIQPVRARPEQSTLTPGWPVPPQWMELHVDVSKEKYNQFQVTIDNIDQGRLLQLKRLARDSNRELRLALNSSAFGPGEYLFKIDGYTWRGQTEEVGWLRLDLR